MEGERYSSAEFIDDYQLLAGLGSTPDLPQSLVLIDTEDVGGIPTQTTFHLSPMFEDVKGPHLLLERGVHKLSIEESQAPFYPDPTQRIILLRVHSATCYLAVSVSALLELKNRGGAEIGWDEWKGHVAAPRFGPRLLDLWVSGCRLFSMFSTHPSLGAQMRVYDFSVRGRVQYMSEEVNQQFSGLKYLLPTPAQARIPWKPIYSRSDNGSIVFFCVSFTVSYRACE